MGLNRGFIVAVRIMIVLISMIELALTASIFDFIVNYGKFYTLPDEKILIEKNRASFFYFTVILAFVSQTVALSSHLHLTILVKEQRKKLFEWLEVISAMVLTVMAIVCCTISMNNAANLSKFAFNAEPRAFQQAARWYYTRFYASAVFWTMQAALSAVVFLATLLRRRTIY
uniref:MARVEL domain-containing protein n=1 Tax=Plectus sambesii TaxID=2011161 RepID=A0A914W8S9_9BILA